MAKVFTITEGLENLGALRVGGQGSVYKARRRGDILVAVKLLPTPVQAESDEDKNYKDFQSEVAKLKKVNEEPNPHVVKILNSGITESGSLPFIEMEFIEGPDLGELLTAPRDPIFSIAEIIKVADQLANALHHCHQLEIKHGDIKSNNIKWNKNTGNYILLDFGLALMSDEQRRSSLKYAGAVEFMAPEQNEGVLLFQSDVYSYGIVLYELLTGTVPFPLKDNGNTARNAVMMAHLETSPPDALQLRKARRPDNWSAQKCELELQVPQWLLNLIYKCLAKQPENRFVNGTALYETIIRQKSGLTVKNDVEGALILQNENERLQSALHSLQQQTSHQAREIDSLRHSLTQKEQELTELRNRPLPAAEPVQPAPPAVMATPRKTTIAWLPVILIIGLVAAAIGIYFAVSSRKPAGVAAQATPVDTVAVRPDTQTHTATPAQPATNSERQTSSQITPPKRDSKAGDSGHLFGLATTYAYFHNSPDAGSKRKANINIWNNARLTALDDSNGYIYVVYQNERGQVSKGWLDKRDLKVIK